MIQMFNQPKISPKQNSALNLMKVIKWCFLGIAIQNACWLFLYHMLVMNYRNVINTNQIPAGINPEDLKQALQMLETYFWPVHIILLLHIFLLIRSYQLFNQFKWHWLLLANALVSLFVIPMGPFVAVILLGFLYIIDGKKYLTK